MNYVVCFRLLKERPFERGIEQQIQERLLLRKLMGFEKEIPDPNAGGNEGGALLIREFRGGDFHGYSDHLFTPVLTLNGLSENLT